MRKLINQLLKFGLVGGIAFLIDYGLLFICTEWFGIYYFISSIISFSVSVIFNYIASVLWVFDVDQEKSKTKNFIIFIALSIVGLGINQIIMYYGVEVLNLYYMLIKLIATFIVMIFNFITRKMFLE
ncbi:GtrA family protein [Faecalibacillus faecis]|uniref:GtrA family protein n=1 Tax=Faecalibacillus faecis TaxID=1982628 RepID=UPI002F9593A4